MIDTQTQKMFWYLDFHLFFLIFKRCSETITPLVQMQSEQQIHTCQVEGLAAPPKTNFLTSTPSCGVTQEEGWHFKYGKRHAALTEALHTLPTRLFPHHVTEERSGRVQHDVRISCDEFNSICRVGEVASSQIAAARSSTTFTSFFFVYPVDKARRAEWVKTSKRRLQEGLEPSRRTADHLWGLSSWVPTRSKFMISPLSLLNVLKCQRAVRA